MAKTPPKPKRKYKKRQPKSAASKKVQKLREKDNLTLLELKYFVENTRGGGNTSKMFDKVISDLKSALAKDLTIEQACTYARINPDTYYRWVKLSEEFKLEMKIAKSQLLIEAKVGLAESIKAKDIKTIMWLLSRREKETYSTLVHEEHSGEVTYNLSTYTKEQLQEKTEEDLKEIANNQLNE